MLIFRTRLLAAALVTAAVAAACGSGESSGVDATASPCAPGVTDDEVNVGILYPDTGVLSAQFTGYRFGVEARFAEANATGGVGGRQVSTIWRDDRFDAAGNLQAARDLLRENVFAVLEYTAHSEQSTPFLHDKGIPVVGIGDQAAWADNDNMFPLAYQVDDTDATSTLGDFVRAQGGTRAAIITTAITESAVMYAQNARRSLEAAGIPIVFADTDASSAGSSPEAVARIVGSGADTLISLASPDLYTGAVTAAAAANRPFKVALSPITYDTQLLNTPTARALVGTYSTVGFSAIERNLPAHRAYLAAMTTYAPEIQPPTQLSSIYGYITADLFLRGLQAQQGCPTRESYISGLHGLTHYDAGGLLNGPVNLAAGQRTVDLCTDFVRVAATGSAFEPVGAKPLCGRVIGGDAQGAGGSAPTGRQ